MFSRKICNVNRPQGQDPRGMYVVVCSDSKAADQITNCLQINGQGRILSFNNSADLAGNLPSFNVDMLVIAGDHPNDELTRILKWARRHWAKGVTVVIGDPGDYSKEIAARSQAAFYLTRPTQQSDWDEILSGVTQKQKIGQL